MEEITGPRNSHPNHNSHPSHDSHDSHVGHDILAAVATARDAMRHGLDAANRSYGLSDADVRAGLVDAFRLVAATQALALALTKELDTRPGAVPGAAGLNGAKTFLVEALRLDGGQAKGFVDCAHALDPDTGDLAHVGRALGAGEVGLEQASVCVRAVARLPKKLKTVTVTDEPTGELVSGLEAVDRMLARTIPEVPPKGVGRLTDQLLTLLDPDREERFDPDAHLRRGLSLTFDSTGMGVLRAYLPPAEAILLKAVLSQLATPDPQTTCTVENPDGTTQDEIVRDRRSFQARQYDAWMALIRRGLLRWTGAATTAHSHNADEATGAGASDTGASGPDASDTDTSDRDDTRCGGSTDRPGGADPSAGDRSRGPALPGAFPEVKLIITATAEQAAGLRGAGKATLDRVGPIDARTLSLFTCSATLRRVLTDPRGVPLDVGRTHRLAPPALRAALVARDRGCVVPGCAVPAEGCDAHHVVPWSRGGPTDLANMVLACPRHHQSLHDLTHEVEVRDGIPYVRPPAAVDPLRRWRRNPLHHSGSQVVRLLEQLTFALAGDENGATQDGAMQDGATQEGDAAAAA